MNCTSCGRTLSFIRRGNAVGDEVLCPDCFAEIPPQGEMKRLARFYADLDDHELLSVLEKGTSRHRLYSLKAARDELSNRHSPKADRAEVLFSAIPNVERIEPLIRRQQESEMDIRTAPVGHTQESGTDSPEASTSPRPQIREVFLTTETSLGIAIAERLQIVSSEAAINMRGIRDFLVGTVSSGEARSLSSLDELQSAKRTTLEALRHKAREMDAHAVVGVTLRYEQLGAGINMLLVIAAGTAVRLARSSSEDNQATPPAQDPLSIPVYQFDPRLEDADPRDL